MKKIKLIISSSPQYYNFALLNNQPAYIYFKKSLVHCLQFLRKVTYFYQVWLKVPRISTCLPLEIMVVQKAYIRIIEIFVKKKTKSSSIIENVLSNKRQSYCQIFSTLIQRAILRKVDQIVQILQPLVLSHPQREGRINQTMLPSSKQQVYEVEDIIDEAIINNEPHYLIKWEGYPHEYDTWEPISSLGNIIDFLMFWLKQRKAKLAKSKQKQRKSDFNQVKPYVDRQYLQPKRKSVRQQYADQQREEKKRSDRQKFGEKILKKKKTWQKYLDYDQRHIDLVEDEDEENRIEYHKEALKSQNSEQSQIEKMQDQTQETEKNYIKNQEYAQAGRVTKVYEQSQYSQTKQVNTKKQGTKQKQAVKVIDYIDPAKITKICKLFIFKGIRCVQVQCANGKHINMKQEQLKIVQPILLMEYYENNKLSI